MGPSSTPYLIKGFTTLLRGALPRENEAIKRLKEKKRVKSVRGSNKRANDVTSRREERPLTISQKWIKSVDQNYAPTTAHAEESKIHHHLIAAIISSDFGRKGEKPQEEAVFTLSERWLYVRGAIQMCGLSHQHRLSCVVVSVKERRSGEGKIRRRSMTSRRRRCCRNWHRNVRNLTVL